MKAERLNAPQYLRWLKCLADSSGLHPENREEHWPLFDHECRTSPNWVVQHWWAPTKRFTLHALKSHGVTVDAKGFSYARSRTKCNRRRQA